MLKHNSSLLLSTALFLLALFGPCIASDQPNSTTHIQVGGSLDALHDRPVTDAEIAFQLIFNELLAEIDIQFTIKIFDDHDFLIRKFKQGDLDAVFLSSLNFLDIDDQIHPTGRYVVQYGDTIKQRSLVLVHREKQPPKLSEFSGKHLSYSTGLQIGKRFLDVKLVENGLPTSDRFFSQVEEVKDANTAIVDLYFRKVDMIVVPELSYSLALELNPQIGETLEVLMRSEPMVYQIVGMRLDFPQETIDRFEPYILSQNYTAHVQHLFKTFRMSRIRRATTEIMQETKALNDRYKFLLGDK